MRTLENYVKCLGKMDYREEAWKTSRPKFTEENLHFDRIAEMDLSINSMCIYTFEIRSSVIVRDLILSIRPIAPWAMSTRSMPINRDTICLSSEHLNRDDDYAKISAMFDKLEDGASRDQVRDMLPLTVSSTYTFTIDYRALISFCKNLEIISPMLYHIYAIPMFREAGIGYMEFYKSNVKESLKYYLIEPNEKIKGVFTSGNIVHTHFAMKAALASQFLRQHYSKIKIGLWNILNKEGYDELDLDQSSQIDVVGYIDVHSYSALMSIRSHWVIDWGMDMWGGIVGAYIENMSPAKFWAFIPNGNGKNDPYWADVYNRVVHEDPGVPCPIMCEWPALIERKEKEIGPNPVTDKYKDLVKAGFIKDNPNNKHRLKYISLGGQS